MAEVIRSSERDAAFLEAISSGRQPGLAAVSVGYTRAAVFAFREADPEFAVAWREADALATERMEEAADARGVTGIKKPVFYQGEQCAEVTEYSDALLVMRLKAKRPEVYRERYEHASDPDRPLTVVIKSF